MFIKKSWQAGQAVANDNNALQVTSTPSDTWVPALTSPHLISFPHISHIDAHGEAPLPMAKRATSEKKIPILQVTPNRLDRKQPRNHTNVSFLPVTGFWLPARDPMRERSALATSEKGRARHATSWRDRALPGHEPHLPAAGATLTDVTGGHQCTPVIGSFFGVFLWLASR